MVIQMDGVVYLRVVVEIPGRGAAAYLIPCRLRAVEFGVVFQEGPKWQARRAQLDFGCQAHDGDAVKWIPIEAVLDPWGGDIVAAALQRAPIEECVAEMRKALGFVV